MLEYFTLPDWFVNISQAELSISVVSIIEIITSIFCGLIIGSERERKEKPAGLRTIALICLGSTLYTSMSILLADRPFSDPGRIAAQIVTGVGFLGAGVIMRERGAVIGLTTAATIWVTAAVGLMVGFGYCIPGLGVSLIICFVLRGLDRLDRDLNKVTDEPKSWKVSFDDRKGLTRIRIRHLLNTYNVSVDSEKTSEEKSQEKVSFCFRTRDSRSHSQLLNELTYIEGVESILIDS